ncbi:thiamine diphosphokinase [Jeotgalibaca sp. MA1X17-3]|nr:thiamine diphosphokinase [Jeotgalibaca sp. MA1X17-3]
MGVDGGAMALLKMGVPIDLSIGDFDSISPSELGVLKKKSKEVIELPAEKEKTDTEAALDYVRKNVEVEKIKMFGLLGGRVDHMISNLWIAYHPEYQDLLKKISIVDQQNTLQFYLPGTYCLKKEANKTYLSFIGLSPLKSVRLKNVKYPLDGKDYLYPIGLISNEFLDEIMEFSFEEGLMAVIQSRDKTKN